MATAPVKPPVPVGRGRRVKRASGDEREQAIRDTLEQLLADQPYHRISIDDLARGAGISRPTFYFYFPSKEAVLLSLLDEIVSEADANSDAAQALLDQDPTRFLSEAIGAYFYTFGAHRAVALAGAEAGATNAEIRLLWNQVRERWVVAATTAIEAERERGGAPDGVPARDLAIALLNMNEGVLTGAFLGDEPTVPEERIIDVLTSVWLGAIYQGPAPTGNPAD